MPDARETVRREPGVARLESGGAGMTLWAIARYVW